MNVLVQRTLLSTANFLFLPGMPLSCLEPILWDSENIENEQQVNPLSQSSANSLGTASNINGMLSYGVLASNFDPMPEVSGSPLVDHLYGEEGVSTEDDLFDEHYFHRIQPQISPSLMTFDQNNGQYLQVSGGSNTAGNSVYRDEDFLHEIGVEWTSEALTHASLEDFNRLIATVKVPSHVEALRGIRKRGECYMQWYCLWGKFSYVISFY